MESSETTLDNSNEFVSYTIDVFEALNGQPDVIEGRDNFEFIDIAGLVSFPQSRTFQIEIANTCDNALCELEFGIIPQKTGYYGISTRIGFFGPNDGCQDLTFNPIEIQNSGDNNFEIFE